jgi:hypothetical protein
MVSYVDLFERFCSDLGCVYEQEGEPLYIDNTHLSMFGSRFALLDAHL